MVNPYNGTELFQMFSVYFGQDYDLFTNVDKSKPFIPQVVGSYKHDIESVPKDLEQCISELRTLISLEYQENKLEDEIFPKLGIAINLSYLKLTHQEFLKEVLQALESKNSQKFYTGKSYFNKSHNSKEGVLGCKSMEEILLLEEKLSNESPYTLASGLKLLFPNYFGEEYNDFTNIDERKPIIPQIISSYKESVPSIEVEKSIDEISKIIQRKHKKEYIRDKIFPEFGIRVSVAQLDITYQEFLERVHEELVGKKLYS